MNDVLTDAMCRAVPLSPRVRGGEVLARKPRSGVFRDTSEILPRVVHHTDGDIS